MVGHTFLDPGQLRDRGDLAVCGGDEAVEFILPGGDAVVPGKSSLGDDDRLAVTNGSVAKANVEISRVALEEGVITLADDIVRNSLRVQIVKIRHGGAPASTFVNMNNKLRHFGARGIRSVSDSLDRRIHQLSKPNP